MQSELHDRLEYLVNYSSQLIFVSGDSISEQQKTLEAFVFQQHDDTEIAYLTAQDNMEPSDYRRQLCRQLLGQVVGSFVRPLNELLSELNQHDGPILIAITQAHHIPDKLLQELWDLVLQSRFAGNKQHLNVLLFANSQWAENAKQWLPAKNTETPLIISSQSVMSEQPTFESELDKMISARRHAFQAHLENRQKENTLTFSNPLKSRRLYAVIATVFIATFIGLVYWQYSDNIGGLFTPIESGISNEDPQQVEVGSSYDALLDSEQTKPSESVDNTSEQAGIVVVPPFTTSDRVDTSQPANSPIDEGESFSVAGAVNASESETKSNNINQADGLVTNWNNAISSLAESTPAKLSEETSAKTKNSDISELPEQQVVETETQLPSEKAETTSTSWLAPNQFVVQMLAMKNEQALKQFLVEHKLVDSIRIYKTKRYGGDWFVVVANTSYPSLAEAQNALATLPAYPGKANAFVKRAEQVLNELSVAND
ncbi:hypothetical protein D210916BOD24_01080 [Alteromonas sp. D210916BOD_24]|uniref:SPOR domain-containing protein n=1 Tax=Alteromonas sp. D210916BOD_24 TaxID=3157618 RepID=UPI00399D50B7